MMRGCKGMKSTSFQLPSSSTFCVGSLHFLCFDAKADAIPADRGPHSKEGSIISIASLICHHFSRKLGAWKPHEDAYLLVLDVIVQLKSEQTMNRLQAATGRDQIQKHESEGQKLRHGHSLMYRIWCASDFVDMMWVCPRFMSRLVLARNSLLVSETSTFTP